MKDLPSRVFCTGTAGCRWSYIVQMLETIEGANTSDRTSEREWHNTNLENIDPSRNPDKIKFTGHRGVYFGTGMELEPRLDQDYLDGPWDTSQGTRFIKSHEWAYKLDDIKSTFSDDWILMVYRPSLDSFAWWHQVGGFSIDYPDYSAFEDHITIYSEIIKQNRNLLDFSTRYDCTWNHFTNHWVEENFGRPCAPIDTPKGVLVTLVKP